MTRLGALLGGVAVVLVLAGGSAAAGPHKPETGDGPHKPELVESSHHG